MERIMMNMSNAEYTSDHDEYDDQLGTDSLYGHKSSGYTVGNGAIFNIYKAARKKFRTSLYKKKRGRKPSASTKSKPKKEKVQKKSQEKAKPLHMYNTSDNASIMSFIKPKEGTFVAPVVPHPSSKRKGKPLKRKNKVEDNQENLNSEVDKPIIKEVENNTNIKMFMKKKEEIIAPNKKRRILKANMNFKIGEESENNSDQSSDDYGFRDIDDSIV